MNGRNFGSNMRLVLASRLFLKEKLFINAKASMCWLAREAQWILQPYSNQCEICLSPLFWISFEIRCWKTPVTWVQQLGKLSISPRHLPTCPARRHQLFHTLLHSCFSPHPSPQLLAAHSLTFGCQQIEWVISKKSMRCEGFSPWEEE